MEQIKPGTKLHTILSWIQDIGGSDLHLQEQKPARYRIEGRLNAVSGYYPRAIAGPDHRVTRG